MDTATIQVLAQALHHVRMDTGNEGVSTLCAACSWAGHNMGWPLLFSGSIVAGVGAAGAGEDGSPSGGSAVPGFRESRGSDPSAGSYAPIEQGQRAPDPGAASTSNPIDPVYQALVKHLQGKVKDVNHWSAEIEDSDR